MVDRVLAGDQAAFGEIVRRHQRWVTVLAYRSTGDLAEADDVAQDLFLRAYHGLAAWRHEASFRTWIGRILVNLLRDRARAAGPRDEPLELAAEIAEEPAQERRLLDDETLAALRRAYEAIPPGRQRQVVRMRFLEGRRLDEIAAALGLRVGTVKAHLFRGGRKLRAVLAEPPAAQRGRVLPGRVR